MKNTALLGATALVMSLSALPAFAQTEIAAGANATGVSAINTRITDIQDDVKDDFARSQDADRFGPSDRREGLSGGISASYTGRKGTVDNQDFALAGRMSFTQAQFSQNVGLALTFGEDNTGAKDEEEVFVVYDAQYYFNDRFYAFALGRLKQDALAGKIAGKEDTLYRDGFLGFGPGYRVINTPDTAWRVQAGVGVRYTKQSAVNGGASDTEVGYIASSRFYHRFSDTMFVTNDTDMLYSKDQGKAVNNELGLNFKMSDAFATRVSYITDYQEGRKTDNKLGVSLVYGF
ncbi:YdiY family protein [Paracoccus sp. p4-l81]|uniref:DUF481 domain-containing protein n=1 Tax=unclassified Paracoccus (in: a-proteobacteria) TaxID=2688777 RepID=UPI0035BA8C70